MTPTSKEKTQESTQEKESTQPIQILAINLLQESFTVANLGKDTVCMDGYSVQDQEQHEGKAKRNEFRFADHCPGLTLAKNQRVTVFCGPSSSDAREYDGKTKIHWFNYKVWNDTGDTGYLLFNGELLSKTPARREGQELEGEVKWYEPTKGYGFIHNCSDGGPDIFVHQSQLQGAVLDMGHKVKFTHSFDDAARGRAKDVIVTNQTPLHASLRNPAFVKRLKAHPEIKLGRCKWFDPTKGFGFVVPVEDGAPDLFMHHGDVEGGKIAIAEHADLEYQLEEVESEKNPKHKNRAVKVTGPGGLPLAPAGTLVIPPGPTPLIHTVNFPRAALLPSVTHQRFPHRGSAFGVPALLGLKRVSDLQIGAKFPRLAGTGVPLLGPSGQMRYQPGYFPGY